MIVAEWKPIQEICEQLRGHKNVLVAGCATCVAECAAGGEREVEMLAPLLKMAMQIKGNPIQVYTKTLERQCEWEFVEELDPLIPKVDAIVSIACGIGIQALAARFSQVAVYPGVNTTSLSIREAPGLWEVRCEACGDCMLGETYGICPVSRCAKSLMNGPCGGTRKDGKCEVNEEMDCVWKLIMEKAGELGRLDDLRKIRRAKDWSNSRHGGQKRILREDQRP
ncbi:MAG: methylenetetrahydrofolate reductase C-terminal domain-containing protein [bacterium]